MSKAILEMYRKAGIQIEGKGIHTMKAHKMVIELIKQGYSKDKAWAIAMSKLGRNAAVKKSHWDKDYKEEG